MNHFSFGGPRRPRGSSQRDKFTQPLTALPSAFSETHQKRLDAGARILLPPSCLEAMSLLHLEYPLQFKITAKNGRCVYAGVLEFVAPEGNVILPRWLFLHLQIDPMKSVLVETVSLTTGTLVKLRPHQRAFVEAISDPRKILEQHLQNHPILTKGTTFDIEYCGREFMIDVLELTNAFGSTSVDAVLTVTNDGGFTELKVEFARPLDMPDSPVKRPPTPPPASAANVIGGQDGVSFTPLQFKPPSLLPDASAKPAVASEPEKKFEPFKGEGRSLKGGSAAAPATSAAAPVAGSRLGSASGTPAAAGRTLGTSTGPSTSAAPGVGRTLGGTAAGQTGGRQLGSQPSSAAPSGTPSAAAPAATFAPFHGQGRSLR